jgi:hypothetical protein
MKLTIGNEIKRICKEISDQNWSENEWAKNESDDWFQHNTIVGGFSSDDNVFLFSYYDIDGEWWFDFSLSDVSKILNGEIKHLKLSVPERF